MTKISQLLGKEVLALSGERLGKVADVLLDAAERRIAALVVREGWFAHERVLRFSDVHALGTGAVMAAGPAVPLSGEEWRDHPFPRCSDVTGRDVVTASGRRVGILTDLFINEQTGDIEEIEIGHEHEGLTTRWSRVACDSSVAIGDDAVIVPAEALS